MFQPAPPTPLVNTPGDLSRRVVEYLSIPIFVVILAAGLYIRSRGDNYLLNWSLLAASLFVILAIFAAARSAGLPFAVRHTYNLHYVLMTGFASLVLIMPLVWGAPGGRLAIGTFTACLYIAGPWTFAHLMASATGDRRHAHFIAAATALILLALQHAGNWVFVLALLLLIVIPVCLLVYKADSSYQPVKTGPGWAVAAFFLLNFAALIGLGVAGFLAFYNFYQIQTGADPVFDASWLSWSRVAIRWAGGIAGFFIAGSAVFLWPQFRPSKLLVTTALGGLFIAAATLGATRPLDAGFASLVAIVAIVLATSLTAYAPRKQRIPHALVTGAIGSTMLFQNIALFSMNPLLDALLWLPEAVTIAAFWLLAYLFGLRIIRRRAEESQSAPDTPPPPPVMPQARP